MASRLRGLASATALVWIGAYICRNWLYHPTAHMNSLYGYWAALAKWGSRRGDGWKDDWDPVFFAGLIFQLSSLAFTGFLLAMLLWAALSVSDGIPDAAPFGGVLLVSVLCGAWGVHSWRTLQLQVRRASTRSIL